MKLATLDTGVAGQAALLIGDELLDLGRAGALVDIAEDIPARVRDILADPDATDAVRRVHDTVSGLSEDELELMRMTGTLTPLGESDLLAPVPDPKLILSVGLNYHHHLAEMKGTPAPERPSAFQKNVSSLTGSGKPIVLPPQCPDMVDYESEFCFVFGRTCHNVGRDEAMDHVAGYTIANDVSARDWVGEVFAAEGTFPAALAWERNIMGKQLPTFTPCGPVIATADEIADPHDLLLEFRLNGEVLQSTRTDDLIFGIPEIIAYFSQWFRFEPGDIVTTGSPAGVGFGRDPKIFMKPGDMAEVTLEGVGTLRNPVVAG
jgi:acylpyruvate hydrolase